MSAQRKPAPPAARNRLIKAVHVAARRHGIEDDAYRDMLVLVTGKRSCSQMNGRELGAVLDHLRIRAPGRGMGRSCPQAKKIKALWISGYWLGVVRDQAPEAMRAFVRRQTGIEAERWLRDPADARKVIEALKDWLAREADVCWDRYVIGFAGGRAVTEERPRQRVVEAQLRRLRERGVQIDADALGRHATGKPGRFAWGDREWDLMIQALGRELRGHLGMEIVP